MNDSRINETDGTGLMGLLFIVFLVLKLTGVISWSWWWVTAPLWGPAVFFLGILGVGIVFFAFLHFSSLLLDRLWRKE